MYHSSSVRLGVQCACTIVVVYVWVYSMHACGTVCGPFVVDDLETFTRVASSVGYVVSP
jgi:hypothetical protein